MTGDRRHAREHLVHDDAEREYAYDGGATARAGWTVVSMKDDWSTVFADT